MDVSIMALPGMRVIKVHKIGPYGESAPAAWRTLCAWAAARGLLGPETLRLGQGGGDPAQTPAEELTYDAALSVDRSVEVEPPVTAGTFPAGDYAVVVHKGPYAGLAAVYRELMGVWLPQSGRQAAGMPFEIYRNDAQDTPQEDLLTEIRLPLRPPA